MCTFFLFNDTATTEIYTLSLHDALPISMPSMSSGVWMVMTTVKPRSRRSRSTRAIMARRSPGSSAPKGSSRRRRSEEHTSELQSRQYLVCRLLLEKKKKKEHV